MGDLRPGHLKGTVANQHQGAPPAGHLQADGSWDSKPHGCVVGWPNTDIGTNIDCREQTIAGVAHHRKISMAADEVVEDMNQMSNPNAIVFGIWLKNLWRNARLPPGNTILFLRQSRRLHQPVDKGIEWHVVKHVMSDEDFARYAKYAVAFVD